MTTVRTAAMSTEILTLKTTDLYLRHRQSLPLPSLSPLTPIPTDFPVSKLIPKSRFVVDGFRFAGEFSLSYFLSHFHSDHYCGLSDNWTRGIVYCSDITGKLAVEVLGVTPSLVVRLPFNERVIIDDIEVTLIDANHCPGAVQFLFKIPIGDGKFERYIHTGDFRFCETMKLSPNLNQFVGCDSVFLDTTYCNPKFVFPLQQESIDYVVDVVDKILVENRVASKSVLVLIATYVIGKERILLEIAQRCGCKVYVDGRKMKVLRALGYEDEGVFSEEETDTDVHVVGWNVLGETWPYFRPNFVKMKEIMVEKGYSKVVGFVPTGWTYEVKRNKFAVRSRDNFEIHLVPYSEHSNYDELREYVKFLKPKHVIPTVGVDVENVDSKHAVKLQKHFAGLVDEMANKQEFVMGFYRTALRKDEAKLVDSTVASHKLVNPTNEESDLSHMKLEHKSDPDTVFCSSSSLNEVNPHQLNSLSDEEREKIMQELRDCLPIWVTEDQMSELIKISGRNTVDAISYFYEHETEFHEQSGTSLSTPPSNIKSDCTSVPYPGADESSLPKMVKLSDQKHKYSPLKPKAQSSVSPGKRKRNPANKQTKKAKANSNTHPSGGKQSTITKFFGSSNPQPSGEKQCTITKFFGKNSKASEECKPNLVVGKCNMEKSSTTVNSDNLYKEELEQFLQIIKGSESMRSRAVEILEKTGGNINVALDMYYSDSDVHLRSSENQADISSNLVLVEGTERSEEKERFFRPDETVYKTEPKLSAEKVAVSYISLPPEKYSPVEHACWKHGEPAPYMHLARTFDVVEGEKGKIKATAMLCNMFRSLLALSPEDVLPAVYLCTNRIAADHENVELNIGGSLVASALEETCGTNRARIKEMYNTLGDLGDVAQECRQTQSLLLPPSPLLIRNVYATLRKISVQTGSGSTGRRKSLIVGLMRSCREKEMKFLVRMLVRNLRIGAMEKTVLPALAQAVAMSSLPSFNEGAVKNLKELLQGISAAIVEAYNVLPDLNVLVPCLMSKGAEFSTTTLTMVPGIPIKPMLAKITNGVEQVLKLFQNKAFTCEYKYDGQRAQIHKLDDGSLRIFSRNGDETTSRFPDLVHIIQELAKPDAASFVLDAEVIGIDRKNGHKFLSFQELSSRERGSKASMVALHKIKVDICVLVFDVMFINGEKLLAHPLRKRRQCLKDLFSNEKPGYFEYAKEITVEADDARADCESTLTKINAFLEDAFQSSCEGIMVKSLDIDAAYFASKRSDSWLKVKRDYLDGVGDSLDLVPIGAWHGNGRKAGWYSPFLVACYNPDTEEFQSVCRVMSGFSDSFYTEMKNYFSEDKILSKKPLYYRTDESPDIWFTAELVWEIRGADLTISPVHKAAVGLVHESKGISMRFPRFIRSLSDRRVEDCSTSTDIADMFQFQTRKMDVSIAH